MDGNDLAVLNRAIQYAQSGYKEKAFDFIKMLAQKDANNMDLILWGMYTAPNLERAELLLTRAKLINPDDRAIPQAEQWLTNEKFKWPHPPEGYTLFPPRVSGMSTAQPTQIVLPVQPVYNPQPAQPPYQVPSQPFYPMPAPAITQQIIIQTAPAFPIYACPHCRSNFPPLTGQRISTGGWITFVVLLILFFPLCWIGLFSKEVYQYCGQCGVKFN